MNKFRLLLASLGVLLGIYVLAIEPFWLDVTIHPVGKSETQRMRIVQLSDLHLHEIGRREIAVMAEIERLQPDLLILSGDVIDRPESLPLLENFLVGLSPMKAFAILGNWEYWGAVDLNDLRGVYVKHGATLLENSEATVELRGRKVRVIGLDDFTAGRPKHDLLTVPTTADISILAQHSPGFFESPAVSKLKVDKKQFNLCISGHTHAGQLTLFGWSLWSPPGSGSYVSGWYDTPICQLYVSRGIGTSLVPARLFARPEIAVFEL
jgi:uncharacterized protein